MSTGTQERANAKGLVCRKCGWPQLRVLYTRRGSDRKLIRRRECRRCGMRATTWEKLICDMPIGKDTG